MFGFNHFDTDSNDVDSSIGLQEELSILDNTINDLRTEGMLGIETVVDMNADIAQQLHLDFTGATINDW